MGGRSRFGISNRCETERGFVVGNERRTGEGREFRVAEFARIRHRYAIICIYTYIYGTTREIFFSFSSSYFLFVYQVKLISWTVKRTEFSVVRQLFPGPRECTPRNRAAVVRTPPREVSPPSVLVAASCSSSSPCNEVSLCELWI